MGTISIREPSGMLWELVAKADFVDVESDGRLVASEVLLNASQFKRLRQAMDDGDTVRITMPATLGEFEGRIRSIEWKREGGCSVTLERARATEGKS